MSHKRAFSKTIIETDAFQDMSQTAQLLYFYLNMSADDDGFVSNPKKIMRAGGFMDNDFKILIVKRFILTFESGVVVIKHWLIHNTIRKDRYSETAYLDEKKTLQISENKAYTDHRQPNGNQLATQDKIREDKIREDNNVFSNEKTPVYDENFKETYDSKKKTYQKLGINYKPKNLSTKQEISVMAMRLVDFYRDLVFAEHRLQYLNIKDESRNKAMRKLATRTLEEFSYDKAQAEKMINWYIEGGGEWCEYRPENCFSTKTIEAYKNKDVPKSGKVRKIIEL